MEEEAELQEELYNLVYEGKMDEARIVAAKMSVYRDMEFGIRRKLKTDDNRKRRAEISSK